MGCGNDTKGVNDEEGRVYTGRSRKRRIKKIGDACKMTEIDGLKTMKGIEGTPFKLPWEILRYLESGGKVTTKYWEPGDYIFFNEDTRDIEGVFDDEVDMTYLLYRGVDIEDWEKYEDGGSNK